MPKNKTGGNKSKGQKNASDVPTALIFKADGQMYAVATKILGGRRVMVRCDDGSEKMAIIMGRFKGKSNWISLGTVVLVNVREYSKEDKVEVCHVYDSASVKQLRKLNELDGLTIKQDENDNNENDGLCDDGLFDFDENANDNDIDIDEL